MSGLPPGTRLLSYFSHAPASVEGLYFGSEPGRLYTLFENIRRLTAKRPAARQVDALQGRVVVDGVATLTQPGPGSTFEPGRPVVLASTPLSGSRSETELKSQFCCQREYSTAKATRAYARGRVYFEAMLTPPES